MQTTPLPTLGASAGPTSAPQAAPGSDGSQFGAALSREVDQRSAAAQPAHENAEAKVPQQPQKPQQSQPAQQEASASEHPSAGAKTADAKPAAGKEQAKDKKDDDAADAASTAAGAPATDMLAIVAGVAQLLQRQGAVAPTAAPGSTEGTAGKAGATAAAAGGQPAGLALATDGAVPADAAAARFAALVRGQGKQAEAATPAGSDAVRADSKASARGATLAAGTAAGTLAPTGAPTGAPSSAPTGAPSLAPSAAPAALAAQLAAAVPHDSKPAAPDQAAAQLLAAAQAQQAAPAMAQVQAQAIAAENHIPAQLGTPAWDNQVGQKIVWMVAGGEQSASLTLNPPDLGPMQVVLNVSGDQASVAFSSSHQDVRHALESALPRLREMMGESGIALGSATVSAGMPDQRQSQDNWQGAGGSGGGRGGAPSIAAGDDAAPVRVARTTVLGDRGMVDTFA